MIACPVFGRTFGCPLYNEVSNEAGNSSLPDHNTPDFYRARSPGEMSSVVTACGHTSPNPIGSIKQALDAPQRRVLLENHCTTDFCLWGVMQPFLR